MPNYQNGKIYKIESLIGNCVYYGSTVQQYLSKRLSGHKKDIKYGKGVSSYKVLQYDDAKIYLVELYPCNSKDELHKREGWYIKNNDCVNKMVAGRTKKEWRDDNKEKYKKYKSRQYICECGTIHRYDSKIRHMKTKKHIAYMNNPFLKFKL